MFHRDGFWLLGLFAAALGAGILIAAIFPVGALLFLVAFFADCVRFGLLPAIERSGNMNIVVWKSPKALRGILRKLFRVHE